MTRGVSEYSLAAYGQMIRDPVRMPAYAKAINSAVFRGAVVADIGTGTGIFAMLAAQAGARKIFAIDPSEMIAIAEEVAATNGFADAIDFIQARSTETLLPEPVDVIVSDLRGVLPLHTNHIPSIIDARERLLRPGGVLIPAQDTLWACPAESPIEYADRILSWDERRFGLDLHSGHWLAANTSWKRRESDQPLAAPALLATLNYYAVSSPDITSSAQWCATQRQTCHGFMIWFDTELAPGFGFTNAPDAAKAIYGQAFFPLSIPVLIEPGDELVLKFEADLVGGDYVFRWATNIFGYRDHSLKASYKQSTFFSTLFTQDRLAQLNSNHAPVRNPDGDAVAFLLDSANGHATVTTLAVELHERFPDRFHSFAEAQAFALKNMLAYCR